MLTLRPYQVEALHALNAFWHAGGGHPLIGMATATGKSVLIAELLADIAGRYPAFRALVLVHVRELLEQNLEHLLQVWPEACCGINSAGLGRRNWHAPIVLANVQSVWRNPQRLGRRDLIIVDEAQLVPHIGYGMYRSLIAGLRELDPAMRVCGFTATPYRLDSGRLDEGAGKIFDKVIYDYGIADGIRDGWLAPLSSKATGVSIDVSAVAVRGGEFVRGPLEDAADDVVKAAVDEIIAQGQNRKTWLLFCAGVRHAQHVCDALRERGIAVATLTAATPGHERDAVIAAFRAGTLRALTNVNVLTTGFNVPAVDLIALLRPTLSTGLYVQMVGRGTRKAQGKHDCLVLDFAGNVMRHGPVDRVDCPAGTVRVGVKHPDTGKPYVWTGSEALEHVEPSELPALTADILSKISAALAPFGYQAPQPRAQRSNGASGDESAHRQLNEAALANLSAWVPALGLYRCRRTQQGYEAVAVWRPSTTGRPPEKRRPNLKIVPEGIRDFGTDRGYTALDLVMAALACDLEAAWQFLSERLGFAAGLVINFKTRGAVSPAPETREDALQPFTYCPGVVGDIVDFIVATARRPNRVLALAAAVTVVGTLIGRRVAGPTRSATHLYVVPVAPTGSGKQHLLEVVPALMKAAGAQSHIGPGEFISMPAVINFIMRKPLSLCLQDEYGAFLKRITARRASGYETAISKVLRTLWGTSFSAMATPEWANREMKIIQSPAISILGLSTPDEFHGALQGESVANGFLNRFLVLNSNLRAADVTPRLEPGSVPEQLSAGLRALYLWSGPQSLLQIDNPEIGFVPDILPWATEHASECHCEFERMRDEYMDGEPELRPYIARAGEIAIRLATIRAAGRWGPGARIDQSDMEWAVGVSWTASQALAKAATEFVPENERSAFGDKILGLIRRRGTAKVRDVQQYVRGALHSREIKDLLAQFVEAGLIEWTLDGYRIVKER